MGILKTITEEYFGETVREEDGKKITVRGCEVIVPQDWDEKRFLDSVELVLETDDIAEFVSEYWYKQTDNSKFINIECGNSYHLCISKYEDIISEDYLTTEDIPNETTFNSIIKLLTHLLEDVPIDDDRSKDYIRLVGEGEIDDALYSGEDELNEFELQSAYDDLMQYFIEEFGGKADISEDDLHSIKYYNYTLNLPIEFKTILYAKDMVKWWDNVLSEIGKQGPKTFFGFDYDYDDSEG